MFFSVCSLSTDLVLPCMTLYAEYIVIELVLQPFLVEIYFHEKPQAPGRRANLTVFCVTEHAIGECFESCTCLN